MQEIERKFLVISEAFKNEAHKRTRIVQGFLNTHPERTVRVRIQGNDGFITIKNNKKSKPSLVDSTNIGLRNLSARYKFVCNKEISIQSSDHEFVVKLPLIHKIQENA